MDTENVNEIGGYFELELQTGQEYHNEALRFNSGRNALSFYLINKKISDLYVPYYLNKSVLEAIVRCKTIPHFYHIDELLSPILTEEELGGAHIMLVNYFGVCEKVIKENLAKFKNVICDYSHAFFSNPEVNIPTFYSPRKFFGVADGGYLYAPGLKNDSIVQDDSAQRYMASLVRLDGGSQAGYFLYRNTEHLLREAKIRRMSTLTQKVLASIRYDQAWEIRENNFKYLHSFLRKVNQFKINKNSVHGPMIYPLIIEDVGLAAYLGQNKIISLKFWPEVTKQVSIHSLEYKFSTRLCALPIDQRYNKKDMDRILEVVFTYLDQKSYKKANSELVKV